MALVEAEMAEVGGGRALARFALQGDVEVAEVVGEVVDGAVRRRLLLLLPAAQTRGRCRDHLRLCQRLKTHKRDV